MYNVIGWYSKCMERKRVSKTLNWLKLFGHRQSVNSKRNETDQVPLYFNKCGPWNLDLVAVVLVSHVLKEQYLSPALIVMCSAITVSVLQLMSKYLQLFFLPKEIRVLLSWRVLISLQKKIVLLHWRTMIKQEQNSTSVKMPLVRSVQDSNKTEKKFLWVLMTTMIRRSSWGYQSDWTFFSSHPGLYGKMSLHDWKTDGTSQ